MRPLACSLFLLLLLLISCRREPSAEEKARQQPILAAAIDCDLTRLPRHLKDINVEDAQGNTALHWTIRKGCLKATEMLLAAGANARLRTKSDTPLTLAVQARSYDLVFLLLHYHADLKAQDVHGKDPLAYARELKLDRIEKLLLEAQNWP